MLISFGQAIPSLAQDPIVIGPPTAGTRASDPLSAEQIQARLQQLQGDTSLPAPQKQALIQLHEAILNELKSKAESTRIAKEREASAEAAPNATLELQKLRDNPPARDLVSANALQSYQLAPLQSLLQSQQTNLQTAIDGRTKVEAEMNAREARKKELPRLIVEDRSTLQKLSEKLTAPGNQVSAEPLVREAELLLLRAQMEATTERIRKQEQELRMYEAEAELLPIRKAIYAADERYYAGRVKEIADELSKRRETKIEEELRKAERLGMEAPAELKPLADRLVKRAQDWLDLAKRNAAIRFEIEQAKSKHAFWDERYRIMTERSQMNNQRWFQSINSWNGLLLRRHRNELPETSKLQTQLNDHLTKMQQTETLIIELEDWKNQISAAQLDDVERSPNLSAVPRLSTNQGLVDQSDRLMLAERELVTNFTTDAISYFDNLYTLSDTKQTTIELIKKYRAFIDQHILWVRSAQPMSEADMVQVWPAIQHIFAFGKWREAIQQLTAEMVRRPWRFLGFAILWGVIVVNASKMRRMVAQLGERAGRATMVDFLPTLQTVVLTLLLSSPLPLLLVYLGYHFQEAGSPQSFTESLGLACLVAARYFYPLEVIRQICRQGGLGARHFEWPLSATRMLHRHLRWLIDLGVPAVAICGLLFNLADDKFEHSLGRLCFIVLMILCSAFLALIMRPHRGVFDEYLASHRGGWADRLSYVWYGALVFGPVLLMVNSLSGFHYTALRLSMLWHTTLVTIVGLFLLYQLMQRWLTLRRRQIMTEQARLRLQEAQQREPEAAGGAKLAMVPSGGEAKLIDLPRGGKQVDMVQINAQTQRLSVGVFVVLTILALCFIWSGVLPAVNVLNSITLWTVQGATPSDLMPITLANILVAVPIIALTFVAARNFPGLLEIALLQRLPLENASRYAMTSISRYAILMLGIVLTFNTLGVRWASIQWLVAALGVGLGFGLQEIFANFISGLILLFEQPIRVGDVITMGDTTGSVTRIRMRATTITNWDRQELVIPNKDLVTGRLLNWTLTDATNRLVLTVGVAYGTDTDLACRLITEICENHENVLTEPPPTAHFDEFADSTLNLKVRLFLDNLETRVTTKHELLTTIHRRFAEANIEIAFPQRDLHIRTLPKELSELLADRQ